MILLVKLSMFAVLALAYGLKVAIALAVYLFVARTLRIALWVVLVWTDHAFDRWQEA